MTAVADRDARPPLQGIVFDFDGVLADTERLHLAAYQAVLAGTGLTLDTRAYYDRYLGYDDVGVFTTLGRDQGRPLGDGEIRRLIAAKGRRFDERVRAGGVLFPEAAACIRRLAAELPLAIASGALHHEIDAILTGANVRQHFRAIVAADDVEHSKPAPDTYVRAVARLHGGGPGLEPAAYLAVEDSVWGITAAHAAGLPCAAITNSYPADVLTAADLVVDSLGELQAAVLQRLARERGDLNRSAEGAHGPPRRERVATGSSQANAGVAGRSPV